MRLFISSVAALMLLFSSALASNAATPSETKSDQWKTTIATLNKFKKDHAKNVVSTLQLTQKNKQELTTELKSVKQKAAKTDSEVQQLISQYEMLLKKEAALKQKLQSRREEIKTFEGTVRTAAKLMQDRASTSFLTQQHPERLLAFKTLLASGRMPGLSDLQSLIDMYFKELRATGTLARYESSIIAPDGKKITAEIFRTGTSSAFYRTPSNTYGFLEVTGNGTEVKSVEALSSELTSTVVDAFAGNQIVPLDFSHGAAFVRLVADSDIWTKIKDGGVLVWPILGIGVIALLLALERFINLGRMKRTSPEELTEIMDLAENKDWTSCYKKLSNKNTPTKRVLWATLKKSSGSPAALEKGMQEALIFELGKMERFLPTMQTLAAVAPLLGLLGTVTGMINTFQVITLFGTGDPHMLSGGISEALVTTQLGLAVAIPIMMLHHVLNSRVDSLANDMEEKGTALIATILNGR